MAFFHVAIYPDAKNVALDYPEQQERVTIPGTTPVLIGNGDGRRKIARISTTGDCHFERNGTATLDSQPLFEKFIEHVRIIPGHTIDVITLVP